MVADSGATSSCGTVNALFIQTKQPLTKLFYTLNKWQKHQKQHTFNTKWPTVDIVPGLQCNSLLSINKFAEANYLTVFTPDEVKIFDGKKEVISSTQQPILQVWRDPVAGW